MRCIKQVEKMSEIMVPYYPQTKKNLDKSNYPLVISNRIVGKIINKQNIIVMPISVPF